MRSLVETLVRRQIEMAETDAQFAHRFGVSRSAWTRIRLGGRRPGERFLSGVMRGFPDLILDCMAYLRDGDTMPENVTERYPVDVTEVA